MLEAALLLIRIKNRDLREDLTPEVRDSDFLSLYRCSESSPTIWLAKNTKLLLYPCAENWTLLEVAILGADQKERSLEGWECPH